MRADCRANFLRPLIATPQLPIGCCEKLVSRALTVHLRLEERDTFFVQYHIPGSEFWRATFSMRQLQVGPIEIGCGCFRQLLRTSAGDFEAAQKGCCCRGGRIDQTLSLRRREEYRCFRFVVVRQCLQAPGGWVANMSEAMRGSVRQSSP